jgi:prepilin-type N-terminal cleavage/methylation domain-containing protein
VTSKMREHSSIARCRTAQSSQGFTLLEVLVALVVLTVGAALTMSLVSGSLAKIKKVQAREHVIEQAEEVMETALLDNDIQQPTTLSGNFDDGASWTVNVEDYQPSDAQIDTSRSLELSRRLKMLSYTVDVFGPNSRASKCTLQTIKTIYVTQANQLTRTPQ